MATADAPVSIADSNDAQRTIGHTVVVTGPGGFDSRPSRVVLTPSGPETGIRLRARGAEFALAPERLADSEHFQHTTCLRVGPTTFVTMEHLLAAIVGLGITNLTIEVGASGHVPIVDGSSAPFCDAILDAGIVTQHGSRVQVCVVRDAIHVATGESHATIVPANSTRSSLSMVLEIDYAPPIGHQVMTYEHSPERFLLSCARARTFMSATWNRDHAYRAFPGFHHADAPATEANMVTHDGSEYLTALRMPNECAAHKVVDVLGDLAVLGFPINGRIYLYRPGHRLMHGIVRKLSESLAKPQAAA